MMNAWRASAWARVPAAQAQAMARFERWKFRLEQKMRRQREHWRRIQQLTQNTGLRIWGGH